MAIDPTKIEPSLFYPIGEAAEIFGRGVAAFRTFAKRHGINPTNPAIRPHLFRGEDLLIALGATQEKPRTRQEVKTAVRSAIERITKGRK